MPLNARHSALLLDGGSIEGQHSMRLFFIGLGFCLVLAAAGCSKSEISSSSPETPPEPPQEKSSSLAPAPPNANAASSQSQLDACSLLTGEEIETIQGAAPKERKSSEKSQSGLVVSQCYFLLPTASDSIILTLTQRADGPEARDPRQSWAEIFHRDGENAEAGGGEKKRVKPENVPGLGDEAFWVPQRFGGALYVLKGNSSIRISVGGTGDLASHLEKSKSLAEMILKRL